MYKINKEIALEMLSQLPVNKINTLKNALNRNLILTSTYSLGQGALTIYKEGFYLTLDGTRARFSVFAFDNDGELVIAERKPHETKLHKLYEDWLKFDESDFGEFH